MQHTPVPVVSHPYPPQAIARSKELLQSMDALFGHDPAAKALAQMVYMKYPVHAEQAKREAATLGVDPVELMIGNLCYDLLMGTMGCSTMALATADGPILARNMDWFPAEKIAKASCLVPISSGVIAGFAGMIGVVTGMSERGFALALNAVFGGFDMNGYPVLLFLRHVLDEAPNYDVAVEMVTREPLMSGGLITIVGTSNNQRVVVERATNQAVRRSPEGQQPLCTTNHYRAMSEPEACGRYDHLAAHAGKVPALEVLTNPAVAQEITSQHVLLQPSTRRAEMSVPSHLLPDNVVEHLTREDALRMLFS